MAKRKSKRLKLVGVNPKNETEDVMARGKKHVKIHGGKKGRGKKGRGKRRGGKRGRRK
jgi:hypothetical protein